MKLKKWRLSGLLLAVFILLRIFSMHSQLVEKYYSRGIYLIIGRTLNGISSFFPFALGELLLFFIILGFLIFILRYGYIKRRNRSMLFIGQPKSRFYIQRVVASILSVAVAFQLVWGLNYSRQPLAYIMGLEVQPRESRQLYEAFMWHIGQVNEIRSQLEKTDYEKTYKIWSGYQSLGKEYGELSPIHGEAKGLITSIFFSYAGISGIYNPFLSEPNFNADQVDFMHPVVMAHEMAHLQGFAREDEANYIAVRACLSHDEAFVNYSGHMLAIIHMSNALYYTDPSLWKDANNHISQEVRKDFNRHSAFWKSYDGWFNDASSNMNDRYLKVNGQTDGIASYGRMIDLLLASFDLYKN
ncbi:DUF3810 domain-containing protein [Fusibacter sp. JL216-2]|uniref:DUF3810 domain-containing protein n=1 Tax=Fusibacter sp. JL216-2 TaxID=3071453 RepID=UPI003D336FEA